MDDLFKELQDPATSAERLYEISQLAPQFASHIAQHPNAYPELVAWAQTVGAHAGHGVPAGSSGPKPRTKTIAIVASVAAGVLLVAGAATTAWALSNGGQDAASSAVAADPAAPPEPQPEPASEFADEWLDPEVWEPQGSLLVYEESDAASQQHTVHAYLPGTGETSFVVEEQFQGDEVVQFNWAVIGEESPGLAFVAVVRTPAEGITAETLRVEAVGVAFDGTELGRYVVVDGVTVGVELGDVVGSFADASAVVEVETGDFYEGNHSHDTYGIDLIDGTTVWHEAAGITAPVYGAVVLSTGFYEFPPDSGYCATLTGRDVATGEELWSVAASDFDREENHCPNVEIYQDYLGHTVMPGEAMHDALIGITIGQYGPRTELLFDARTGESLTHLSTTIPLYDPIQGFALRDDRGRSVMHVPITDPVAVYSPQTGATAFEIDMESADRLDLRPVQLFDGVLYATTTDEQIAIDMADGETIEGGWIAYPTAYLGDWAYLNDGTLKHRG